MASNYSDSFAGAPYFIKKGEPLSADNMTAALNTREKVANKTDAINNSSTEYPSSKAVYDGLAATVHLAGAETLTGVKTFGTAVVAAEPVLGKAKTTEVVNDGTKIATEAQVYKAVQEVDILPVGTILAMSVSSWVNASTVFKSKWKVCDGTGGTPDLRGRFLRGGTSGDAATGGADSQSITLQVQNIPSHKHSIVDNGHRHPLGPQSASGSSSSMVTGGYTSFTSASDFWKTGPAYTGITGTENTGGGEPYAISIVPSYYIVIYIMKLLA